MRCGNALPGKGIRVGRVRLGRWMGTQADRHACKSRGIAALLPQIFTSQHLSPMIFARFHFYFYFSYPGPKAEEKR
jgi:hypothetical protein